MTYDHELILIKQEYIEDDVGNQIPVETRTKVLCAKKSVSRKEFYNAATARLRPDIVFIVHGYEYDNQQKVEFEGTKYSVIRTYCPNFEEIEIICEKVVGDG